jgi:polygalacturonase
VFVENIVMTDVPTPFAANAFYFCDPDGKDDWVQSRDPAPVDDTTPSLRNIHLSHIRAEGVSIAAVALLGLAEAPIRGVQLRDFLVSYTPKAVPEVPLMTVGMAPVRHAGLIAEFAEVEGEITVLSAAQELEEC